MLTDRQNEANGLFSQFCERSFFLLWTITFRGLPHGSQSGSAFAKPGTVKPITNCHCNVRTGGAKQQTVADRPCGGAGICAVAGGVWVDAGEQYEG